MSTKLFIGTSGLLLPVPNKRSFPPEFQSRSRLTYYASLFNSIEVNSSFYKVPQPATFNKWSQEVPDHFRFTIKLWRGITHEPHLHFIPIEVNKFMHAIDHLGSKKGCLLIQLPPSIKADRTTQLQRLLERIIQADPTRSWRLAVEFRNKTWYTQQTAAMLTQYQITTVLHDMPASRFTDPAGDLPFVYLRFHGPAGDYKGAYGIPHLQPYAEKIRHWLSAQKEVYVYFNNTIGDSLADLSILRHLVHTQSPLHPPAPLRPQHHSNPRHHF